METDENATGALQASSIGKLQNQADHFNVVWILKYSNQQKVWGWFFCSHIFFDKYYMNLTVTLGM